MNGSEQPSEEELRMAVEEQLRRLTVGDVVLQTAITLINLAGVRLGLGPDTDGGGERDLEQARLGIEGARALVPLLPAEQRDALKDALAQLQLAFARESRGSFEPPGAPAAEPAPRPAGARPDLEPRPSSPPNATAPAADEAERARARAKIWVPPGS